MDLLTKSMRYEVHRTDGLLGVCLGDLPPLLSLLLFVIQQVHNLQFFLCFRGLVFVQILIDSVLVSYWLKRDKKGK